MADGSGRRQALRLIIVHCLGWRDCTQPCNILTFSCLTQLIIGGHLYAWAVSLCVKCLVSNSEREGGSETMEKTIKNIKKILHIGPKKVKQDEIKEVSAEKPMLSLQEKTFQE
eukprot:GFUD01096210.1.p1 GENE.GFUD01096210.1~~GFUD01096210.1.p1  ORF type:complete len:113 (+),score=18.67 GFUD01096210.1:52-390(+)